MTVLQSYPLIHHRLAQQLRHAAVQIYVGSFILQKRLILFLCVLTLAALCVAGASIVRAITEDARPRSYTADGRPIYVSGAYRYSENADGTVDIEDVVNAMRYFLGKTDVIYLKAADITGDGQIDIEDVVGIGRIFLTQPSTAAKSPIKRQRLRESLQP